MRRFIAIILLMTFFNSFVSAQEVILNIDRTAKSEKGQTFMPNDNKAKLPTFIITPEMQTKTQIKDAFIIFATNNLNYSKEEALDLFNHAPNFSNKQDYAHFLNEKIVAFEFYDLYNKIKPNNKKYAIRFIVLGDYHEYVEDIINDNTLSDEEKVKKFERTVAISDIISREANFITMLNPQTKPGNYFDSYMDHGLAYKFFSPIVALPICVLNAVVAFVSMPIVFFLIGKNKHK